MNPCGTNGKYTFVDGFCGAGGVTEGFIEDENIEVIAAINHSKDAINCYKLNNPNVKCFEEDFTLMDEKLLPRKVNIFWVSAECTHHSIAAGGNSRDADSRSQPEHIERYAIWSDPDYIYVENVKEILSWGPTIKKKVNGKFVYKKDGSNIFVPDKNKKGTYYKRWVKKLRSLGYKYEYKILDSADFGAHTSRKRYFGVFAKRSLSISWPETTHSKSEAPNKKPWNPCYETIDLNNEGTSIFGREFDTTLPKHLRRKLVHATLRRIAYGIAKFSLSDFIAKSYSNGGQWSRLNEPLHTITTVDRHALISLNKNYFIAKQYTTGGQWSSLNEPLHTITNTNHHSLVQVNRKHFITQNIQKSINANSILNPLPTILTI